MPPSGRRIDVTEVQHAIFLLLPTSNELLKVTFPYLCSPDDNVCVMSNGCVSIVTVVLISLHHLAEFNDFQRI